MCSMVNMYRLIDSQPEKKLVNLTPENPTKKKGKQIKEEVCQVKELVLEARGTIKKIPAKTETMILQTKNKAIIMNSEEAEGPWYFDHV